MTLKIGTVEFAIAATPESMYFSPQRDQRERDRAVDDADREAVPAGRAHVRERLRASPCVATRKPPSRSAANASRSSIIAGGEKSRTRDLDEQVRRAPDRGEQADQERSSERVTCSHGTVGGRDTLAP